MTIEFGRTELVSAGVCADSWTRLVPPGISVPGETVLSRPMTTSGKYTSRSAFATSVPLPAAFVPVTVTVFG